MMRTSFHKEDVILLLKDITGLVEPEPAKVRERRIQSGVHYSEMLPQEYRPTEKYMREYENALHVYARQTAEAVCSVAELLYNRMGRELVLVSLARSGIPVGVLIKRYLKKKYGLDCPHYGISIIRGRGIDKNAMDFILERHPAHCIQFVDGWTGKGAILKTLAEALGDYPQVSSELAVLADPARLTELCGTHEDFLIPSSCLNATISGLVSRTFLRGDIIGPKDFHGAHYYGELADEDETYRFIETVEAFFDWNLPPKEPGVDPAYTGMDEVKKIAADFGVKDINLVKPGVGETTRVLLRRVPRCVLVNDPAKMEDITHIRRLAQEREVPIIAYPLKIYRTCGVITELADV